MNVAVGTRGGAEKKEVDNFEEQEGGFEEVADRSNNEEEDAQQQQRREKQNTVSWNEEKKRDSKEVSTLEGETPTKSELHQIEFIKRLAEKNRTKNEQAVKAERKRVALRIKAREAVIGSEKSIVSRLMEPKRKTFAKHAIDNSESEREERETRKKEQLKAVRRSQYKGPDAKQIAFLAKLAEDKKLKEFEANAKKEKEERRRVALVKSVCNMTREANAKRQVEIEEAHKAEKEQKQHEDEAKQLAPKAPVVPGVWKKHVDSVENNEKKLFEAGRGLDRARWAFKQGIAPEMPVFICSKGYPAVRDELLRRGWYENPDPESDHWDLLFTIKMKPILKKLYSDEQIVNRFIRSGELCTKGGIARNLQHLDSYTDADASSFFPRCYNLSVKDSPEIQDFAEDFCVTAAERLLKVLRQACQCRSCNASTPAACQCDGNSKRKVKASPLLMRAAARVCNKMVRRFDDEYVDSRSCFVAPVVSPVEWALIKSADPESLSIKPSLLALFQRFAQSGRNDQLYDLFCSASSELAQMMSPDGGGGARVTSGTSSKILTSPGIGLYSDKVDIETGEEAKMWRKKEIKRYVKYQIMRMLANYEAGEVDAQVLSDADVTLALEALEALHAYRPQNQLNGSPGANCWIVKPADKSRGRGIACFNNLEKIIKYTRLNSQETTKWVVQKYMENSLIVHRRKFDIRQWLMVTCWNPLTIYFYDDCYLRFCVNEYTMDDEAMEDRFVHLANNSISKNSKKFDSTPIEGNMWRKSQFIDYINELRGPKTSGATNKDHHRQQQGVGENEWANRIKPGLQQIATRAMMCVQDLIQHRGNSFEIFGFDFMLDDELNPWLIEINSSPSMEYSTQITKDLAKNALASAMSAVLDAKYKFPNNETQWAKKRLRSKPSKKVNTGKWELIHCGDYIKRQLGAENGNINELGLDGKALQKPKRSSINRVPKSATTRTSGVTVNAATTEKDAQEAKECKEQDYEL